MFPRKHPPTCYRPPFPRRTPSAAPTVPPRRFAIPTGRLPRTLVPAAAPPARRPAPAGRETPARAPSPPSPAANPRACPRDDISLPGKSYPQRSRTPLGLAGTSTSNPKITARKKVTIRREPLRAQTGVISRFCWSSGACQIGGGVV